MCVWPAAELERDVRPPGQAGGRVLCRDAALALARPIMLQEGDPELGGAGLFACCHFRVSMTAVNRWSCSADLKLLDLCIFC